MTQKICSITTTYHRAYNYGATLQAYALQQTLLFLGFENQILDYVDPGEKRVSGFYKRIRRGAVRAILAISQFVHRKEIARLHRGFDDFTDEHLILTQKFTTIEAVSHSIPQVDCYLSGSDQVFTLRQSPFLVSLFMLDYGEPTVRRYSYAASLANYDLNEEEKKRFSSLLSRFDHISLRETVAAAYLSQFTQLPYEIHIDPVFLLTSEQWRTIAVPPAIDKPYILYFQVNSNPIANDVLGKLRQQKGLQIVCLQTNPIVRVKADRIVLDATPQEFLGWLANAETIVTTSFHGTAFSILFEKDFYTLTKPNSNPLRIEHILTLFGLNERLISQVSELNHCGAISYFHAYQRIDEERTRARAYLTMLKKECETNDNNS